MGSAVQSTTADFTCTPRALLLCRKASQAQKPTSKARTSRNMDKDHQLIRVSRIHPQGFCQEHEKQNASICTPHPTLCDSTCCPNLPPNSFTGIPQSSGICPLLAAPAPAPSHWPSRRQPSHRLRHLPQQYRRSLPGGGFWAPQKHKSC